MSKKAIIIGAGPAGLTAAYELLTTTDIKPVIFEMSEAIGGISQTVKHNGNCIDIGGHRFFSKNKRVMDWWFSFLPLQGAPSSDDIILKRAPVLSDAPGAPDPQSEDKVMLTRNRLSRIFFLKKFFDYPLSLTAKTLAGLGLLRTFRIGIDYIRARLMPITPEKNLEDFFINRFGRTLYSIFFRDYTHKVWGVPCDRINPDWGAQRIKGLSVTKAVIHAMKSLFKRDDSLEQKNVETSLISRFFYPKHGPGQLWETVAEAIIEKGGEIHFNSRVDGLSINGNFVVGASVTNTETAVTEEYKAEHFISSMPIRALIRAMGDTPPAPVREVASGLVYRDFMTVGLLLDKLTIKNTSDYPTVNNIVPDNWIYIQDNSVRLGRLQIFNNWSPYLVSDTNKVWLGLEYFCNEGDELWSMADDNFIAFAARELESIGIIDSGDIRDSVVIRVPKAYPAYFGTHDRFSEIREFTDTLDNLFLVGRNGMHRYNNMDHSMLSSMEAVKNIRDGLTTMDNVWSVNAEEEYHEK